MKVLPGDERGGPDPADKDEGSVNRPSHSSAAAGGTVEEYIGSRLRQAFDTVAQQPVPDRFLQLIAALDKS